MDLDVFLQIQNQDATIRNAAEQQIMEAQNNPQFLLFLLSSLSNCGPNYVKPILIILANTVRKHPSYLIEISQSSNLLESLTQYLFQLQDDLHVHIQYCLLLLGQTDSDKFTELFLTKILPSVSIESSISNIFTVLNLTYEWFEARTSSDNPSIEASYSFLIAIFQKYLPLFPSSDETISPIISISAKLLLNFIIKQLIPLDQNLLTLLSQLINLLSYHNSNEIQSPKIYSMKTTIALLFDSLLSKIYGPWTKQISTQNESNIESSIQLNIESNIQSSIEFQNNEDNEEMNEEKQKILTFCEQFISQLLPQLYEALYICQGQVLDFQLRGRLFHIFYLFLINKINIDSMINPEFFQNVLVPAAILDEETQSSFDGCPSQYIAFALSHTDDLPFYSSRICAYQFAKKSLEIISEETENPEILSNILSIIASQTEDPLEFEARLYLLQAFADFSPLPNELFEPLFDLLTIEQPLYIVTALLGVLSVQLSKTNPITGIHVAEHFIINSEHPVICTYAAYLFNACIDVKPFVGHLESLRGFIEINVPEIFQALINLKDYVDDPITVKLLEKIYIFAGQDFAPIAGDIIAQAFRIWNETASSDSDNAQLSLLPQLMKTIYTIISTVPPELLNELKPVTLTQLSSDIEQFPENITLADQLRVASIFADFEISAIIAHKNLQNSQNPQNSQNTQNIQSENIGFSEMVLQFTNSAIDLCLARDDIGETGLVEAIAQLIVPIIRGKPFGQLEVAELTEKAIILVEKILKMDEELTDEEITAMIIISALISIDTQYIQLFGRFAVELVLHREEPESAWGASYVFSTIFIQILLSGAEPTLEHFGPIFQEFDFGEFGNNFVEKAAHHLEASYRDVKALCITLFFLGKMGIPGGTEVAAMYLEQLKDMKDLDKTFENNEQRERGYQEVRIMAINPSISLPILESFNEASLFS